MKAKSTIKKQISRLKKVYEKSDHRVFKGVIDAERMALRWVVGDNVCWSPASLAEALLKSELEGNLTNDKIRK